VSRPASSTQFCASFAEAGGAPMTSSPRLKFAGQATACSSTTWSASMTGTIWVKEHPISDV